MKLLQTISYANAPEIGVQFATIEQDEQGTHVYLHFTELKYNYTTQQDETVPYLYHAWATDQARHTAADILNCAKELLGKYACRAKYFGPMVYTVVDAPAEQITKTQLVAATVGALAAALQDEPAATKPLALSVILHAANSAAFAVPTSLYYDGAEVSMKQVCIELSCTEAEVLTTGNGWTAYVQANALDYAGNKRNHLAEQELAKLTDFDFAEAGGIYGPALILKDAE